jgi:hypothetical protein
MQDSAVVDVKVMLSASRRSSYRQLIREIAGTLVAFLGENGLAVRQLPLRGDPVPDDFRLMPSDLTQEGQLVIRGCLDCWLASADRRRKGNDPSILQRELDRYRKRQAGADEK